MKLFSVGVSRLVCDSGPGRIAFQPVSTGWNSSQGIKVAPLTTADSGLKLVVIAHMIGKRTKRLQIVMKDAFKTLYIF
jgi:hypothetical protein